MSHSYGTSTYVMPAGDVPGQLDSPEQLDPFSTAAFLEQKESPGKLVYMSGDTRSGWAMYTAKALIEAVDLPSLVFLTDHGEHKFETEHGYTCVTVFGPSSLPGVIADLTRLLELVKENPILALNADTDGSMYGVEEVAQALSRDYVSSSPAYDYGNVRGDEGQGPDYFFTWLRSILRVMEVAQAESGAVVHELKV